MTGTGFSTDVVVIGGGPGGSTVATMLARQGIDVLILERDRFPRHHVGESLLPASVPVLEELGVMPAVQQAGFLPKWGATMVWGSNAEPWSWYFRETNQKYPHSYQVWRPQFDQLLLDNSRKTGVEVREGHRVVDVVFRDGRATGVRYSTEDGAEGTVDARFVVDASGQSGLIAHKLDSRQWDPFFRNLSVYAYYSGANRLPPPDDTNIFIESYSHGWLWCIPLHTGWSSVGAVVDSTTGQEGIRRDGLKGFLTGQIRQAAYTSEMLQHAEMALGPFIVKDWSYTSAKFAGDGYILVGDAACFVDPLFSSGVHLALMAGVLAAAQVTTALKDPELGKASGSVYQELYLKEYSHFRDMARLFYSSNLASDSYFWEVRRLLDGDAEFSPRHSFIQAVAGQPPRGYERAVLEQGRAPAEFLASVGMVESERAQRRARLAAADGDAALYSAVPSLSQGVRVQRKPVLGEGEFVWGYALTTDIQPEGTPCSGLVASMVSVIDGRTTVAQILTRLKDGSDPDQAAQIERNVLTALQILYVDGAVADLAGL